MPNWQTIEPRNGARADQHLVTVAARRAGSEKIGRPQLLVTIGAQVVRELGWKPSRVVVQADPDEALVRIQPTTSRGTSQMSTRKDCTLLTLQVPCVGALDPHPAEACEVWRDTTWLVLRVPAWAVRGLRNETRAKLPSGPPPRSSAPPSAAPAPVPAATAREATHQDKAPAPVEKPKPAAAPPPETSSRKAEKRDAKGEPLGHSSGREGALRTAWTQRHLEIEVVLRIVNRQTPSLPKFDVPGLLEYAQWLRLGPRPEDKPAAPPAPAPAVKVEGPARHKDRDAVEAQFAAGNLMVREIAKDFGLTVATVSMWLFEWNKAQPKADAA